ncbi:MAG: transketolase [Solirubrobacteraceae bacterium]|jgi:transketolase|nr:transketolase [Solirubrobacteraceae bacterium]MDP4673290.1 transketolase [Solirubrobacteraceae bacterium]MDP4920920.1 transketolase [Solirubrobacteraceae bacterium]
MSDELDQQSVDTIRALSMDAVQKANSGHPGLPLGMAPVAYVLFQKIMRFDPTDPHWPDRDRFVLSGGHGSMLLYSMLHLSGYGVSMDDIKQFRQWGSITPGHPELDPENPTPGVEVTTGPLGQGFANGVGMAIAENFLRHRFGAEVQDHRIFGIVTDGDLMEGIASEAASLAGHLKLDRLVYCYDDNDISLDGPTSLSYKEDTTKRFESYGWHVEHVENVNDLDEVERAIDRAIQEKDRPSLVRIRSIIGYPSPKKQGTSSAHGSPLGEDEVRATKEVMGWDPDKHFYVPDDVGAHMDQKARGAAEKAEWTARFEAWKLANPERVEEWDCAWAGKPMPGFDETLPPAWGAEKMSTRVAGGKAMEAFASHVPTMVGGAADLSGSTRTIFPGGESEHYTETGVGRNVYFGVREHGMGGAVNGMAAHGGIVRPYGATFFTFSDYMRGAIRLAALSEMNVAYVFTHDSVALGEDGPTHQPVEHLAALRAIPKLTVIRPADADETAEAWRFIIADLTGPAALILSRQDTPVYDRGEGGMAPASGLDKGAYVMSEPSEPARAVIVGTGCEVSVAVAAAELLAADGIPTRVVSMPSWELFEAQGEEYQVSVIPPDLPSVSVEAAISMGWQKWVDDSVAIDRFGASAPGDEVLEKLGITPQAVVERVKALIG